jgi:imidazoleglycerol phosphate synthase glutamine amidotransferase subunit HisH
MSLIFQCRIVWQNAAGNFLVRVGVLALQGDVREHISALNECGVEAQPVRTAEDISSIDGLILPGESQQQSQSWHAVSVSLT